MNQVENPLYHYLGIVADLVIVNLLCVVCCLPVVTIGPSLAAACKVTQNLVLGNEGGMIRMFFSAFRENFRQSLLAFLGFAVIMVSVLCEAILIYTCFTGIPALVLFGLLGIITVVILAVEAQFRGLMVRYQNTMRELIHNALLLTATRPIRSLSLAGLHLLPVILWAVEPDLFYRTAIIWPFIGITGIFLLESFVMKDVFYALEQQTAEKNDSLPEGETSNETF